MLKSKNSFWQSQEAKEEAIILSKNNYNFLLNIQQKPSLIELIKDSHLDDTDIDLKRNKSSDLRDIDL